MESKYLPIGTVVLLKGGKKKVMVTGFLTVAENNNTIIYDYSGCLYPEGCLSSKKTLLFNNSQVEKVVSLGYSDDEEKAFKAKLEEASKYLEEPVATNPTDTPASSGISSFDTVDVL